jgi:hypothetical protein
MMTAKRKTTKNQPENGEHRGEELLELLNDGVVALDELRTEVIALRKVLERVAKKLGVGAAIGGVVDSLRGK